MFKLNYNILVAVQVILSLLNATLLINIFGVSYKADAYLMSTSIFISLQFLQGVFFEQFTQFYNDEKVNSKDEAKKFYNATLFLTACLGLFSFVLFTCGVELIASIFAKNLDAERLVCLVKLLKILFIGSAVMPIICINERLFIAEMKISVSYILQIIQIVFVVIAQLLLICFNKTNVEFLAWALSFGRIVALIVSMIFALKIIPFKLVFWHKSIKSFVINSMVVRLGDNLGNFVLPLIVNNVLASLGTSVASCYYYALKIVDILNNISIGPSSKVLKSKISEYMAKLHFKEIQKVCKMYWVNMSLIFIGGTIITYFSQGPILQLISNNKLTAENLSQIAFIFVFLAAYYFFKMVEYPFLTICITAKKGKTIVLANSLFIVAFFVVVLFLIKMMGIYSIPIAMCISELLPFLIYKRKSKCLLYNCVC